MTEMKVSGAVMLPPESKKPIAIGVVMKAIEPMKLNAPLVRPIRRSGATAETRSP